LLKFIRDPLKYVSRLFKVYDPVAALSATGWSRIFSTRLDCPGTVFVYGPTLAREVESQHDTYHKCALSGLLYPNGKVSPRQEPLLEYATGLFSVNDEMHRRHRRLLAPAFHKKRIEGYHADMVNITQAILDDWRPGQRRDIQAEMKRITLRIATTTLFGEDMNMGGGLSEALQESLKLIVAPGTLLLPYDLPGLPYHRFLNAAKSINVGIRAIIARKRARGLTGDDVLSMLLQTSDEDGSALTESEVVGHAGVIFAAGHETSSTALTWTLFLLSQHPRLAADLLNQLDDVLHGAPPTPQQLNQIPLLEYTLKESLRLLPPIVWNTRVTALDTELGGYPLSADTEVIVSIYHTHHQPDLYEQPERFNPYRWVALERDTFEYNPFSGGPRMCLGAQFAMLEMKIVLAMLLQRYRLQFIPGTLVDRFLSITMSPKQGLPMLVQKQDRRFEYGVGGVRGNVREMVLLADTDDYLCQVE